MEQEVLRKVQMTQLEIAKEIRRVCDENNIRYFLAAGTFLGAVRHQGFIPWDDDMDMGMMRRDYEKFCRIAPSKLKPEFCLQTWYTEPNYGLPFGKVMKRGTIYLENKKTSRLQNNGIYVDIFPYDYAPEDPVQRNKLTAELLSIYRMKLMKSGYKPWMEEDKIVLLDYKTDRVNTPQELLDRYETQLLLYAEALERVFSTKEKQMEDAESTLDASFELYKQGLTEIKAANEMLDNIEKAMMVINQNGELEEF